MAFVRSWVSTRRQDTRATYVVLLVSLGLLALCSVLCVAPLQHSYPAPLPLTNPLSVLLATVSNWFFDLFVPKPSAAVIWASNSEFFILIALFSLVYGLVAWYVWRQAEKNTLTGFVRVVWWGALLIGLIFVFTPAMPSKDLFVYADFGHIMAVYGANPYFVVPGQISHDPITEIDGWRSVFSAYGPLWMYMCALISLLTGDGVVQSFFAYRLFGLLCHLISIFLVARSLKSADRTPRVVALGTLFYGWNPLALFESSMGGHNDIFMAMLLLLAIFLAYRAEKQGFTRPANYLPPLVVLTLATLVKFTTLPLVAFFLVLLLRKTMEEQRRKTTRVFIHGGEGSVLVIGTGLVAVGVFVLLSLLFYLPLWWGHSVGEIVHSFGAPPSSIYAENSFMRAVVEWLKVYDQLPQNAWPYTFWQVMAQRTTWNVITEGALGLTCLYGVYRLWHAPRVTLMVMASLAAMGVLLVVTPWFFSWYVLWLVALVAVGVGGRSGRIGRALIVFALVFSVSAFFVYFNTDYLAGAGYQIAVRYAVMVLLPLVVAIGTLSFPLRIKNEGEGEQKFVHGMKVLKEKRTHKSKETREGIGKQEGAETRQGSPYYTR